MTKISKYTIKRIIANTSINKATSDCNWTNVRFAVVNLTTGNTLLEQRWVNCVKGNNVKALLPYYAAVEALKCASVENGKVTELVKIIVNDENLRDKANKVAKAQDFLADINARFSKAKRLLIKEFDDYATACASRKFSDTATQEEISNANKEINNIDKIIFNINNDLENFLRVYTELCKDMKFDEKLVDELKKLYTERNKAQNEFKNCKALELEANDNFCAQFYAK